MIQLKDSCYNTARSSFISAGMIRCFYSINLSAGFALHTRKISVYDQFCQLHCPTPSSWVPAGHPGAFILSELLSLSILTQLTFLDWIWLKLKWKVAPDPNKPHSKGECVRVGASHRKLPDVHGLRNIWFGHLPYFQLKNGTRPVLQIKFWAQKYSADSSGTALWYVSSKNCEDDLRSIIGNFRSRPKSIE